MYVRPCFALLSVLALAPACGAPDAADELNQAATENGLHGAPEHFFNGRGDAHTSRPGGGGSSPLMTLHGGNVLDHNNTYAVWWGSEWSSATFAGDKISGMESFFSGFGGSNFAGTSTEYAGINVLAVTTASSFMGSIRDTSAAPTKAPSTTAAVAEVCKLTGNAPDPFGVYFLYTSTGAGHVSYCAWHSWGTCSNGAQVQVAYMPNIDGIAGCDPQDTYGTGHSQGLAAIANVTSHELSEALTDPRGTGWFDSSGQEDGDKCAWTFTGKVTLANSSVWKLQQEWSNNAYNSTMGSPRGCLQGQ